MKIIIMAGGNQKRYAPVSPKQFIKIDDERIIERIIKNFKDYGDIYLICDNEEFRYLESFGCKMVYPSEKTHELSKFMSSYELWKDDDEVLFLWGDCYLTDEAINQIKNNRPNDNFTFFGVYNEMLALRLYKSCFKKFISGINYIKSLQEIGEGGLCGSWTLYRLLLGKDILDHQYYSNFVLIRDESFDFDIEQELYEWLEKYPQHKGSLI